MFRKKVSKGEEDNGMRSQRETNGDKTFFYKINMQIWFAINNKVS